MTTSAEPLSSSLHFVERGIQWLIAQGPALLSIVLIIALGIVCLRLARVATAHLIRTLRIDVLAERLSIPQRLYDLGFHGGFEAFAQRGVTLIGQLILLHMILERLGLHGLSKLALRALDKLPELAIAGAIFGAGMFAGDLLRRLLAAPGQGKEALATGIYYLVLVISGAMALEQLGLDVSIIHTIILLIAAAAGLCIACAAIVSGRETSRNLAAARYAAHMLQPGDHIRTGELVGAVVAFQDLHVVVRDLDTPERELLIPYHVLLSAPLTILDQDAPG